MSAVRNWLEAIGAGHRLRIRNAIAKLAPAYITEANAAGAVSATEVSRHLPSGGS
jgi:hypothetical protein